MAIFTTTDRDNVKAAIVAAAVSGVASVTVAGQTVQSQSLEDLYILLGRIQEDLASANPSGLMRMVKTIPPEAG